MLDGFVIAGNTIERMPLETTKGKMHALKKHYLIILVSILVHLLLALLLFVIAEKPQIKEIKVAKKAINSYLYKMPAKPIVKQILPKKAELKKEENQQASEQIKLLSAVTPAPSLAIKAVKAVKAVKVNPETATKKTVQATFSAYQQLNSLRSAINEKMMVDELSELQQFRSPSVMHGEQASVPHSAIPLTPEQEREKKTTRMSDDISITKYDNGICTIERKQMLGSPIEGSSSAFACGESKFDKSFREHIKKVQEKLLPVKNK